MKHFSLLHSVLVAPAIVLVSTPGAFAQIAEITNVRIESTPEGLQILLEGNETETVELFQTVEENRLIIEINNARLIGGEFEQENPIEGVNLLQVTTRDDNSIEAVITGEILAPEVSEVIQENGRLNINLLVFRDEGLIITVTAEKVEETIQNVPISITAFSEENIEDANIDSLESIADNTPNFSVFGGGSQTGLFNTYSIRGLSNSNFLSRDTVGFFVDDVPYDYGAFLDLDLVDLERIEVLRGPQNTLYGRNAQAGVVNIITKRPSNDIEGKFFAHYGTYDQRRMALSVSAPLAEDRLFLRLSGQLNREDGYITNTALNRDREVGDLSGGNIRGTLVWTPNDDWEISLGGFYQSDTNETPLVQLLSSDNSFRISQDFQSFSETQTNSQNLKISYENSNFIGTSITTRRYSKQRAEFDSDFSAIDLSVAVAGTNSTVFSQELRFQSAPSDNPFQWLIGGYFENRLFNVTEDGQRLSSAAAEAFGLPGPGFDNNTAELEQTTYAAFGQLSYQPIDPLTLTLGLRYDSSTVKMDQRRNFAVAGSPIVNPVGEGFDGAETNSDALLPRLAIRYEVTPDATIYGSITRGYKPAGLNYRASSDDTLVIGEELSWNYELGVKTAWLDDRLIANLAVFHNVIDDFQVGLGDPTGIVRNIANAQVSITGVEFELKARPVSGFDITAGFGYTNARYDRFFNPFTEQSLNGNKLSFAPEFTFNLAAQYRSPGGFFSRVELNTLGNYFTEETNTISQRTVTTVDATLGYEFDNAGIYLVADNIFDTRFLTSGFIFGERGGIVTYNKPFTARVLFKASF
ncbi:MULTISPECIES: TonB-dependent receptor domain-containing protein [unclassified Roseofilum]|uniref:TonB-dependent receptor domain-containing protein n=1 Tax=unclassified Roseofilum TaxID=2620099 RepID=UPI000E828E7D|nr:MULTISPECIES: TonB-dependent receptor [unclassified Roseofilum]MBP0007652.1 TonB-dependent receptor [Roseofilum sp. Belize Diploria]MBP0033534.1 TonB-dependent receptor [Roseofilum sp. Belize BBD 4]HBQ97677.1 TonB-dependent receptor [Cyanobacteria bacterium UBA11691]